VQPAIKGVLLGWGESASPFLEPPTREPFDAALDGELSAFDQQAKAQARLPSRWMQASSKRGRP
jgi:hypothetical protein